jgi:hypothetical protein
MRLIKRSRKRIKTRPSNPNEQVQLSKSKHPRNANQAKRNVLHLYLIISFSFLKIAFPLGWHTDLNLSPPPETGTVVFMPPVPVVILLLIAGFTFAVEWNVVGVEVFVFMFICILDIATSLVIMSFADAVGAGVEGEVGGEGIAVMEGTVFASVSLLVPLFGFRGRLGWGKRRAEMEWKEKGEYYSANCPSVLWALLQQQPELFRGLRLIGRK